MEMINSMNKLRKHENSARFGFTEYSDMSHGEFITTKLKKDFRKVTVNSVTKERAGRNIIRYSRDAVDDMSSIPKKIDWYVWSHVFLLWFSLVIYSKERTWSCISSKKPRHLWRLLGS